MHEECLKLIKKNNANQANATGTVTAKCDTGAIFEISSLIKNSMTDRFINEEALINRKKPRTGYQFVKAGEISIRALIFFLITFVHVLGFGIYCYLFFAQSSGKGSYFRWTALVQRYN